MSSLAWIDFDEAERQRAQRIMALFQERETRDELGLGAIRDSIADHLFPGTSTIQTRLRYMLFIPWLYRALDSHPIKGRHVAVYGSQVPWYEGICLSYGAKCTTIEYQPIESLHPGIRAITPEQYERDPVLFDADV